jgi:hypothetical protein
MKEHTHQLGGFWCSHNEVTNCVKEDKIVGNKGQVKWSCYKSFIEVEGDSTTITQGFHKQFANQRMHARSCHIMSNQNRKKETFFKVFFTTWVEM